MKGSESIENRGERIVIDRATWKTRVDTNCINLCPHVFSKWPCRSSNFQVQAHPNKQRAHVVFYIFSNKTNKTKIKIVYKTWGMVGGGTSGVWHGEDMEWGARAW